MAITNLNDHMARACMCGGVRFNLLRSGAIECDTCQQQQPNLNWREEAMTLQQLLETTVTSENKEGSKVEVSPDFRVAVQQVKGGGIHFIIHPDGHAGETLDFVVTGNELKPL